MSKNKRIECADGFTMSVQANSSAYCSPRSDNAASYDEVEVGFPNKPEPLLERYAENPENLTETVYGWVPSQTVLDVIVKHGGIVSGELPAGVIYLEA
tara:strand:+ start:216 stop:509 length:294 start_codon:yes stop_codon:yes gene_type:complete